MWNVTFFCEISQKCCKWGYLNYTNSVKLVCEIFLQNLQHCSVKVWNSQFHNVTNRFALQDWYQLSLVSIYGILDFGNPYKMYRLGENWTVFANIGIKFDYYLSVSGWYYVVRVAWRDRAGTVENPLNSQNIGESCRANGDYGFCCKISHMKSLKLLYNFVKFTISQFQKSILFCDWKISNFTTDNFTISQKYCMWRNHRRFHNFTISQFNNLHKNYICNMLLWYFTMSLFYNFTILHKY